MSAREVFVMKKMGQWKENLVTSLEIPRDLAMKETVFTVTGKHQAVATIEVFCGMRKKK